MPHPFRFFLRKGWDTNKVKHYTVFEIALVRAFPQIAGLSTVAALAIRGSGCYSREVAERRTRFIRLPLAIKGSVCYSLKVAVGQEVAVEPPGGLLGLPDEGSGKLVRWVRVTCAVVHP